MVLVGEDSPGIVLRIDSRLCWVKWGTCGTRDWTQSSCAQPIELSFRHLDSSCIFILLPMSWSLDHYFCCKVVFTIGIGTCYIFLVEQSSLVVQKSFSLEFLPLSTNYLYIFINFELTFFHLLPALFNIAPFRKISSEN